MIDQKSKTKAEILDFLKLKINNSDIPNFFYITVQEYLEKRNSVFNKIKDNFKDDLLAIRSSSHDEDNFNSSSAGKFESVLNVPSKDYEMISKSIEKVIKSFEDNEKNELNQIIIQKMVTDCSMSGVVFTHDLDSGAPYYVINYDDISGLTDTVTSGFGNYSNRTLFIQRNIN